MNNINVKGKRTKNKDRNWIFVILILIVLLANFMIISVSFKIHEAESAKKLDEILYNIKNSNVEKTFAKKIEEISPVVKVSVTAD